MPQNFPFFAAPYQKPCVMQDRSSNSSAKTCRFTDSFASRFSTMWRESCSAWCYSSILSRRKRDATGTCNLLLNGHHHHHVSYASRCMHNTVWPTPSVSCKHFGYFPSLPPCFVSLFLLSPSPSSRHLPLTVWPSGVHPNSVKQSFTPSLLSIPSTSIPYSFISIPTCQSFWYFSQSRSREIQVNLQNPAKFSRNLIKYMSVQHFWHLSQLLGLFTCCKLANLSRNFVTEMCKQHPKTTRGTLCCEKLGTSHDVKGFAIGSFLERVVVERANDDLC